MMYKRICLLFFLASFCHGSMWAQVQFTDIPAVNSIEDMLSFAMMLQRKPYCIGAEGPNAFDCSGFTRYCYKQAGIELNRTSKAQSEEGKKIRRKKKLKEGDLVFFKGNSGRDINHVGIVFKKRGGKKFDFIHASTSTGVIIENSETEYFKKRYKTARRVTSDKKIRKEVKNIEKEQKSIAKQLKAKEKVLKKTAKTDAQKQSGEKPDLKPSENPSTENCYVVQKGDTLYNISKRAGCTVEDLRRWNNLTDNGISIGQQLIIK